jgi:Family of unknown function (DUF6152)
MNRVTVHRRMVLAASVVAMVAFSGFPQPALAHHGSALWQDKVIVLKGTVADYMWRNPHVLVTWDVGDDNGKVVRWMGEMASPETLMGDNGMTRSTLKPGDKVIMYVRPAKSGTPHSAVVQIRRADCSVVVAWSRQAGSGKFAKDVTSCTPWK